MKLLHLCIWNCLPDKKAALHFSILWFGVKKNNKKNKNTSDLFTILELTHNSPALSPPYQDLNQYLPVPRDTFQ